MNKNRPKTGFKAKNTEELQRVNFKDIDKYADLLYEEKYENKIKGARYILYMVQEPQIMYQIALSKSNLFDILSRTLRDEQRKTIELSQILLAFFCSYSYYYDFHQLLISQTIGEICMSIIDFQHMKYEVRRDEIVRFSTSNKISNAEYQAALEKFLFLVRKQDRILKMAFFILLHLAEDAKVEKKMVKKDIVGAIVKHLGRPNINLLSELLIFLKKLSLFQVNKDAMIKAGILDVLMNAFEREHLLIWALIIQVLYNLSFDPKFRLMIIIKKEYFFKIADCFKIGQLRLNIIKLLYNLSLEEKSKPLFFESECLFFLYELMDKFPEPLIGGELAALALNLTTYQPNAKKIASEGRVKSLIQRALANKDVELIKIVKNILQYSEDAEINAVFIEFIDESFMKIILNKSENNEFSQEIVDILSYINMDWSKTITKNNLIQFFEDHLKELNKSSLGLMNPSLDEHLLRVIDFLTNISSVKTSAEPISNSKILTLLLQSLRQTTHKEIIFAIVSCLYQLMPWKETRALILSNDDLIDFVIKLLKKEDKDICYVSLLFLEIVQLFDKKKAEMITRKKFKSYYRAFTDALKEIKNPLNENIGYDYEDEDEDDVARQVDYDDDGGFMNNYKHH